MITKLKEMGKKGRFIIKMSDTDVICLCVHYFPKIIINNCIIQTMASMNYFVDSKYEGKITHLKVVTEMHVITKSTLTFMVTVFFSK
jgi:hypothetical protein